MEWLIVRIILRICSLCFHRVETHRHAWAVAESEGKTGGCNEVSELMVAVPERFLKIANTFKKQQEYFLAGLNYLYL
jgi:hypothetical protein